MRLFIAVAPSEKQKEELHRLQLRLERSLDGIKWVRPAAQHLTLKFLGEQEEKLPAAITGSMQNAARTMKQFNLQFEGIGVFPSPRRARVIWAGVAAGAAELRTLTSALEKELAAKGFPAEKRSFRAHLTLGRVRHPVSEKVLQALLKRESSFLTGIARVQSFSLYRSRLTPAGPQYTALKEIFFDQDRGK